LSRCENCPFRNDLLDNNAAHELIIYSVHLARPAPNDALNRLGTPAERMEVPADVDTVTYANADLTETINAFKQYGVRLAEMLEKVLAYNICQIIRLRKKLSEPEEIQPYEAENLSALMSLVESSGGVGLAPLYVKNMLIPSVVARPLQGESPTIDLMMGYN